ncbi:MAG: 50S ribosomal protein L9 [Phycisphaerales bacterium]|nr:50S ribosomal protein L9 [Phycisphaerales bacterium]
MAKTIELLLVETVENLGIVGDVVKVRTGYARNFLLPRELATVPSEALIKSLQQKRVEAEKEIAAIRTQRAGTIEKLKGFALELTRACNDQGILYGAVTQQEIAAALTAAGNPVRPRDVRLSSAIKRVDTYDIHIKFETELETDVKLTIKPDRVLAKDEKPEMDIDEKGRVFMVVPGQKKEGEEGEGEGKERKGKKSGPKVDTFALIESSRNVKVGWGEVKAEGAPAAVSNAAAAADAADAVKASEKRAAARDKEKSDRKSKR